MEELHCWDLTYMPHGEESTQKLEPQPQVSRGSQHPYQHTLIAVWLNGTRESGLAVEENVWYYSKLEVLLMR